MGTVHLHPRSTDTRSGRPSLASYAEGLEEERYHCPEALARRCELLLDDTTLRVLVLSGAGGSGKSAALRSIARAAQRRGLSVTVLDGRAQDVAAELDALAGAPARVVLVDEVDQVPGGLAGLAASVQALPAGTRIALAGRALPARWLPSALEPLSTHLRLSPLAPDVADRVLQAHGVDDIAAREHLVRWARGFPLALVVGARAWEMTRARLDQVDAALLREGGDSLLAHLAGSALDELDPELVAALAVAPGLDQPLLAHLFPGRADEVAAAVRATGVVETAAGRLFLHPTLVEVLVERLRSEEPVRFAATTLRVAGHEHSRALLGDTEAVPRLASLVRDPALRSGLGARTPGLSCRVDRWRPGDAASVRSRLEAIVPGAWSVVGAWAGPDLRVVRREDGRVVALVAALSVRAAEAITGPGAALVAPVLARVRADATSAQAVITALQITLDDSGDPDVDRLRNAAGLAQCGIANPRTDHVNLIGDRAAEREVLEAYGYAEIPGLARTVAGVPVSTWGADAGPGGLAGLLHDAIVGEQGGGMDGVEPGLLLAALEAFDDEAALVRLVSASGAVVPGGIADLRARVRARVSLALADQPALLDLVERRYLTAGATHESVMRATYLSRATYFRRLRRVRELLVR